MATYQFISSHQIERVRSITIGNLRYMNPKDSRVLEAGLGYRLEENPYPEYDPETQTCSFTYALENGVIRKTWIVSPREEVGNATE
ncbi:MAG: hypothetical protein Q4D98_02400 [Planctomycetia bacterium]|nr:hypothetical protein [Planctomycetia bacterium]